MGVADNVLRVRAEIARAAALSGRRGEEITLVAAAKTNGAARVREAIEAGVDAVGENRVQELLEKRAAGAYAGAPLHFIGHLQTNKVKSVVGACDLIESVGSGALLAKIAERARAAGWIQDILLEVNIGGEGSKSGVLPEELSKILDTASSERGICVRGLMAIPPVLGDNRANYRFFDDMYNLYIDICGKKYDNVSMQFLSMGMSGSFAEAIRAGANMVRIGSGIFGERTY
jgi:pyridoxal phosphate enzyme (YggS family)